MFKRDWFNGFTFGLIFGFLLTPTLIFAAILFGVSPDDFGQPASNADSGKQEGPQEGRWWLIGRVVYMDDTAAQWIMTFATIFAAYLLLRTLWATQDMAKETTRIGEAQVRAYLTIESATIEPEIIEGKDEVVWYLSAKVGNCGNSPARRVALVALGSSFSNDSKDQTGDIAAGQTHDFCGRLIMPNGDIPWLDDTMVRVEIQINLIYFDVFNPEGPPILDVWMFCGYPEMIHERVCKLIPMTTIPSKAE
ncbi:hypothetical protein [uncultured Roseovarius sp.]|uniref:hypothetical protein n=1 Tax=uncultured Roseovarius sp. TaxID=293344 RepID=UPI002595B587|nr:hypothetical protein [uncultured Roseovarius sp.]